MAILAYFGRGGNFGTFMAWLLRKSARRASLQLPGRPPHSLYSRRNTALVCYGENLFHIHVQFLMFDSCLFTVKTDIK